MKRPTKLLWRILLDVRLQLEQAINLDYKEICSRYRSEGESFLTITLPRLDDVLLKGLSTGRISRADFVGFKPHRRHGSLPALLQGFFRCIFDDDGWLLPSPNVSAIYAIRQVSRLFKKVEKPCSDQRIRAAYKRYIDNDQSIDWNSRRNCIDVSLLANISQLLWADLEYLSGELFCFPGIFGSGATAEKLTRNERFSIVKWPVRSENSFPASFHCVHNESCDLSHVSFLEPIEEEPVRVVQVPKTLKTPRTISVEPSYMMLMQQSIAKPLMTYLESRRFGFQSIRFSDQSVNRDRARIGSIDGSLATIDLSDASDLVSYDAVQEIFKSCPTFFNFIDDCRTKSAMLPDRSTIALKKFSSMGSALCFPIESMFFFTIVLYSIVKSSGKRPSIRLLQQIASNVSIYGDDIIVDSKMAPSIMLDLEAFGLKINHDKSFYTGFFRESCGGDYYRGVDVTPLYVRQWDDTGTLSDTSMRVSYAALSNSLYMKGLWHATDYLRSGIVERIGRVPYSRFPIGIIHFVSYLYSDSLVWDGKIHGYRVKGIQATSSRINDSPNTLSGFLIGHFQDRQHADSRKYLRETLHACSDLRTQGAGSKIPTSCYSQSDTTAIQSNFKHFLWHESWNNFHIRYADMLKTNSVADVARRFVHLTTNKPRSLHYSERPYVLKSKRRWTASPAGLEW